MERSGAGATKRTQIMAKREKLGRYCRERERERERLAKVKRYIQAAMVKVLLDWTISCIAWLVWDNGQIRWESSEECLVGMVLVRQSMKARYEILMWDGRFKKQMFILNFSYEVLIYCWPKNWTANLFLYIFWPSVKILWVPFWKFRFKTGLLIGSKAGMLLPDLWPDMWPFFVLLYTYSKKFIY